MDGSVLYCGDNLEVLRHRVATGSVDLIYLDPPFNTSHSFHLRRSPTGSTVRGGPPAYRDTWRWSEEARAALERSLEVGCGRVRRTMTALHRILGESSLLNYLAVLVVRLVELHRVLKPTGSIYLHCDPRAGGYIRVLMDAVFGGENFLNAVVWCYGLGGSSPRRWPRKHDDILWYSREPGRHFFQPVMVPADSRRMRGELKKAPDYWLIPSLNNMARERSGYPTQKPEELLERIVLSSSRVGDRVLDPYCGSGTTLVVAARHGRRWIGIDDSPAAIAVTRRRLAEADGPVKFDFVPGVSPERQAELDS